MGAGPNYSLEIPIPIEYGIDVAIEILEGLPVKFVFNAKSQAVAMANNELEVEFENSKFAARYVTEPTEYLGNSGGSALIITWAVYYDEPLADSYAIIGKLLKLKKNFNSLFPKLEIKDYSGAHTI